MKCDICNCEITKDNIGYVKVENNIKIIKCKSCHCSTHRYHGNFK